MTVSHTSAFPPRVVKLPRKVDDDDLHEIEADLADNGVAAFDDDQDQSELAALVGDARDQGIDLSIVVFPGNPDHDSELRDLSSAIAHFQPGTVAVFSDDWIGTTSDTVSRVRLEWAEDTAKFKEGDVEEAAEVLVHRLEQPEPISWTGTTSLVMIITALMVAGLYWVKRRRAITEESGHDDEPAVAASAQR